MKRRISLWLLLLVAFWGILGPPETLPGQLLDAEGVNIKAVPVPSPAGWRGWQIVGPPGVTVRYYWVSAVYPQGETLFQGPLVVTNSPAALGVGNFVQLVWTTQPGALSYNVVRTAGLAYPASGAILVAQVAGPGNQTRDVGAALGAYVLPTYNPALTYLFGTDGDDPSIIILNKIRYPARPNTGDLGIVIRDCFNRLPLTGGTCDARKLEGGTITTNPFNGLTKSVTLWLGAGRFITTTLVMPLNPYGATIIGSGMFATILQPNVANIPVIKGGATPTESMRCFFQDFAVQAHAAGSTGPAIEMAGFRSSIFWNIKYLSTNGSNFNSFFHFASWVDGAGSHCYGNLIHHPFVDTETGPPTVFLFNNGGTANPNFQANQNEIQDLWINGNTGITTVIDALRSALTKVSGGLIENNVGAVALIPGTLTILESVWMETNAAIPIVPNNVADGASNGVKILNNYTTAFTLTLVAGNSDWEIRGNYPAANITVVNSGANNLKQFGGTFRDGLITVGRGLAVNADGFKHQSVTTGACAAAGCEVTLTWTTAFPDANYTPVCSLLDSTAQNEATGLRLAKILSFAANNVKVDFDNLSAGPITGTLYCVAVHQ